MKEKEIWQRAVGLLLFICAGTLQGAVWFVDDDATFKQDGTAWETAFRTVYQALNRAEAGDHIHIAQGTYTVLDSPAPPSPTPTKTVTVMRRPPNRGGCVLPSNFYIHLPLTLRGGFVGMADPCRPDVRDPRLFPTTFSADLSGNDLTCDSASECLEQQERKENLGSLFFIRPELGQTVTLDGLVLTGATDSAIQHLEGGCRVENCVFRYNSGQDGGAIHSISHPYGSPLVVRNCDFIKNAARMRGGAISGSSNERLTIQACRFLGNHAMLGGALFGFNERQPLQVYNSLFNGNDAGQKGGAFFGGGVFTNCTLVNNGPNWGLAPISGQAISEIGIYNSIIADSAEYDSATLRQELVTIEHSLLPAVWPGEGNMQDDPGFVDANGPDGLLGTEDDDLRLQPTSPAINAGNDRLLSQAWCFDLDGRPRRLGTVDMGAYENGRVWHVREYGVVGGRRIKPPEDWGLSIKLPFHSLNMAVESASHGDVILVHPGRYHDNFELLGKRITIRGVPGPQGLPVLGVTLRCPCGTIRFYHGEGPGTVLENLIIKDCGIALEMIGASPTLRNLTIVSNQTAVLADENSNPLITNCILWGNQVVDLQGCQARYSCIERMEQAIGEGNIAQDPLLADPQRDDYHLRSVGGRYVPALGVYVTDASTSPCVDAGNPAEDTGREPSPHGNRINMGAYGGTHQASLSDQLPPSVRWYYPAVGDVVGLTTVTLRVEANDLDGHVATVTFYANGKEISDDHVPPGVLPSHESGEPWVVYWRPPQGGDFELTAVAIDDDGLSNVTRPIIITVDPSRRSERGR